MTVTSPHDPAVDRQGPHRVSVIRDDHVGWRDSAACRFLETEVFFPIGKAGRAIEEIQQAKEVCASCPVRQPCLTFALGTHQAYGIWGGYDEDERRLLRQQKGLGFARRRSARNADHAAVDVCLFTT